MESGEGVRLPVGPRLAVPPTRPERPQAVILTGLQGSGKSTFCKERLFATHVRLSLDMLRTRRREVGLLDACLALRQAFVIDNTNPTLAERARYIEAARAVDFAVIGYVFDVPLTTCLARNAARPAGERVPARGLYATRKRFQAPTLGEGFDALYRVRSAAGGFVIAAWDEVEVGGAAGV